MAKQCHAASCIDWNIGASIGEALTKSNLDCAFDVVNVHVVALWEAFFHESLCIFPHFNIMKQNTGSRATSRLSTSSRASLRMSDPVVTRASGPSSPRVSVVQNSSSRTWDDGRALKDCVVESWSLVV